MDFEFDKEMDALLRQAARGETVSVNRQSAIGDPQSHLDADEISAFAENSLPEKTKALYVEHFADCDRCRVILSTVVSLDAVDAVETVHAAPQKLPAAAAAVIPWYKSLFAAPNLAYALGALVLVFAGLIAYSFLQSSDSPQNAEIAQVEPTEKSSGPNAGDPTVSNASAARSNSGAAATDLAISNASSAMSDLPMLQSSAVNSMNGGSMSNNASMSNGAAVSDSSAAANKQKDEKNRSSKNDQPKPAGSASVSTDGISTADEAAAGTILLEQSSRTVSEKQQTRLAAEEKETVRFNAPKPAPPVVTSSAPAARMSADENAATDSSNARSKKSRADAAETRLIGGKTFKRENGAWYDRNYKGQTTTNVARGSEEFRKLDAGLRSIASGLSGAVVVVYNGRAYRIQ